MAYDHVQKVCYNALINHGVLSEADGTTPIEDFGMDSLDQVSAIVDIEEDLRIELPNETITDCATLGELIAKVKILNGPV